MEADYLIVGAGSAGCVLADRLSEDGRHSVIVIEAGGSDWGPLIQMPAALSYPMNMRRYDWGYQSEPEPQLNGRRLACPRGRVLGGSSSINGMVYVRGHALDFERWVELGAAGWGYRDVLPYFRRLESCQFDAAPELARWRGDRGPVHISRGSGANPLHKAFVAAGVQAGYRHTLDYNGHQQEGIGNLEMTVWKGRRWSAANAYLRPALKRSNCRLVRALARRIVFEGQRAVGVELEWGGRTWVARCQREVILAASAINSPALLLRSGIGPAGDLKSLGIPIVADRSAVGRNLQDHLELIIQFQCLKPISLYRYVNVFAKMGIGMQWLLSGTGIGASNQFETGGFIRTKAGISYPDIQYHFLPIAIRYDGSLPVREHGFQAHVSPMRSKSRGEVRLRSANSNEAPSIQFNYMDHEDDWAEFRACIQLTRELFSQDAFAGVAGRELAPGATVQSDSEIDDYLRENLESAYHPCGTCRMGSPDDPNSVVDPECRVIGVEGLRVADSAIFPQITNGNINAPTLMIGEKASDHILNRDPLDPRDDLQPWVHPDWRNSQR